MEAVVRDTILTTAVVGVLDIDCADDEGECNGNTTTNTTGAVLDDDEVVEVELPAVEEDGTLRCANRVGAIFINSIGTLDDDANRS